MPSILKVYVIKWKHTPDRDFKMDLHICSKKEVVDIEKNSIVCSCVSHKPLMYPPCIMSVQYTGGCAVHRGVIMSTVGDTMSTPGDVQYTGGLSWVQWGDTMSTLGDVQYTGGYHEYTGGLPWWMWGISWVHRGCSVHWGDTMSTLGVYHDECGGYHEYTGGCSVHWGDIMSTPGGVQYTGGLSWVHRGDTKMHLGGYHEYTGGCSVHWRDTMSTPGDIMSTPGGCSVHWGLDSII